MRRVIGWAAPVAVVAALVSAAAASSTVPRLLSCAGKPLVRPTGVVVLSCADANSELRGTDWSSWERSGAAGTTDFGLNLCKPYCAASRMTFFPHSRVQLTGAKTTTHRLLFTRATITYVLHGKTKAFVAYPPTRPLA